MVKEGKTDAEIFDAYPGTTTRYIANLTKVRHIFKPQRTQDLVVSLFYGEPGTGKTRRFWNIYHGGWSVPVGKDLWFTGYQGEKEVLLDDFSGNIQLTSLLQILDRYPVSLPSKGSHVWWCPNRIVITTNCHPCNWYDYTERQDSYAALERRIHEVLLFNKDVDPVETDVHNFFTFQKVIGRFNKGF